MPLKFGFIGAGNISKRHIKNAQALKLDLLGVADVNPQVAEDAVKTFGVARAYADYHQMLADRSIEAVVIGTPNKFHAEQAIAALNAGKHVFLEKPMAMNVGESDAILAAHKRSGKVLQMGMMNRFRASVQLLKRFVADGKCGDIYVGQTYWYRRRGIPGFGGWFTTQSMSGGGALIDIGVHMLDLALYLMDFPKPVAVSGFTYNNWKKLDDYHYIGMWGKPVPDGKKDVDDYAVAIVRFDNGASLQVNVSWAINVEFMQPENGVRLMGTRGGVELKGFDLPHFYGEEVGHLVDVKPHFAPNDPAMEEMLHFVNCITENRQPMPTAEQGRTVQSILDAIYRSSAQKREVPVE